MENLAIALGKKPHSIINTSLSANDCNDYTYHNNTVPQSSLNSMIARVLSEKSMHLNAS